MSIAAVERRARIFMNGRSRAVRIPAEFRFDAQEVVIRQEADGTITMRPVEGRNLIELLKSLAPLPEDDRMFRIDDDDLLPLDEDPLS